jgi:hypothetical protein
MAQIGRWGAVKRGRRHRHLNGKASCSHARCARVSRWTDLGGVGVPPASSRAPRERRFPRQEAPISQLSHRYFALLTAGQVPPPRSALPTEA